MSEHSTIQGLTPDDLHGMAAEIKDCLSPAFRLVKIHLRAESLCMVLRGFGFELFLTPESGFVPLSESGLEIKYEPNSLFAARSHWAPIGASGLCRSYELDDTLDCSVILQFSSAAELPTDEREFAEAANDIMQLVLGALRAPVRQHIAARQQEDAERRLKLELTHRTGNMLAILQSVALQTLRQTTDPFEFAGAFTGRLHALSSAYALVSKFDWQDIDLTTIIRTQLVPYAWELKSRVEISDTGAIIHSDAALAVSLVIHELMTNAIKHGALSLQDGRVQVDVTTTGAPEDPQIVIDWSECGGPPILKQLQPQYGLRSIRQGLDKIPGSSVVVNSPPAGLKAQITLPCS